MTLPNTRIHSLSTHTVITDNWRTNCGVTLSLSPETSVFNTSQSRSVAGALSQSRLYDTTRYVGSVQCLPTVECVSSSSPFLPRTPPIGSCPIGNDDTPAWHSTPPMLVGPHVLALMWSLLVMSYFSLFTPVHFCQPSKLRTFFFSETSKTPEGRSATFRVRVFFYY